MEKTDLLMDRKISSLQREYRKDPDNEIIRHAYASKLARVYGDVTHCLMNHNDWVSAPQEHRDLAVYQVEQNLGDCYKFNGFFGKYNTAVFVYKPKGLIMHLILGGRSIYFDNIINPFLLGRYPVTEQQYYGQEDVFFLPVEVGYQNALDWCGFDETAIVRPGNLRLPNSEEWRLAAKPYPDDGNRYFWGSEPHQDYVWCRENAEHPVSVIVHQIFKKYNDYGLVDLYGNVWEWLEDFRYQNSGLHSMIGGSYREHFGQDFFHIAWSQFKQGFRVAASVLGDVEHVYNHCQLRLDQDTSHRSSRRAKTEHPIYNMVLKMAAEQEREVVQAIFDALKRGPTWCIDFLWDITGEDPCKPESAGRLADMTAEWQEWGQKNGYKV